MPALRSRKVKEEIDSTVETNKMKDNKKDKEQTQWIILGPDSLVKDNEDIDKVICKLPHPRNGVACLFVFHGKNVYELMKFKESYRSWLIDNSVQKDGSMTYFTPIDPLFIALPYLEEAAKQGKYTTLDSILINEENQTAMRCLEECLTKENLINICSCKGEDDYTVFKSDNEKILQWLCKKVNVLSEHLKTSDVNVCAGAQLSSFIRNSDGNKNENDCLRYSWNIVSDYITPTWSEKLKEKLGITEPLKEKENEELSPPLKKQKLDNNNQCIEDYRDHSGKKKKADVKLTAKQKALKKIDKTGMKSMTSFFTKKANK